jgi:hypothetical protein
MDLTRCWSSVHIRLKEGIEERQDNSIVVHTRRVGESKDKSTFAIWLYLLQSKVSGKTQLIAAADVGGKLSS